MLEETNNVLTAYLDIMAKEVYPGLKRPVSREHYLQRCWPVINKILSADKKITVIDAGCGHAYEAILFSALGANVIGIDLREDGFKVALENVRRFSSIFPSLNIELINRDLFVAMKSLSADAIWAREAISHIHPAEKFSDLAYERLNENGLLVINDSNVRNPLVMLEVAVDRWKSSRTLGWFVTDKYRDPVSKEIVPYAMERTLSPGALKRMLRASGFEIESLEITGYIPVSVAARFPHLTLSFESFVKKVPVLSQIGADCTVCGKKVSKVFRS